MATSFPTSLQDLDATRGTTGQTLASPNHITHHALEDDTLEALQAKVGADSSVVTTSHDYKLSGVTGTDKAVSKTGTETLTNKTLTTPAITTPTFTLGSDATGDVWYRHSDGTMKRLAIGSAAQVLNVTGGVPAWRDETAVINANTTTKGVTELATAAEITAGTATGATGAGLAISPDQLALSTPVFNGSALTSLPTEKLNVTTTDMSMASNTTEQTIYQVSIPAGYLSTNNAVIGRIYYEDMQNSGAGTLTLKLKYGSTTMASFVITVVASGNEHGYLDFLLSANASASIQEASFFFTARNSTTLILRGDYAKGTATEDSTGALNLTVTGQFSANGGTFNLRNAYLTRIY